MKLDDKEEKKVKKNFKLVKDLYPLISNTDWALKCRIILKSPLKEYI